MLTIARRISATSSAVSISSNRTAIEISRRCLTANPTILHKGAAASSLYHSSAVFNPPHLSILPSSITSISSRRALHSIASSSLHSPALATSSSNLNNNADDALPNIPSPLNPLPTAPSFDAPLPTLAAPDHIDPSELTIDESCIKRLRSLSAQAGHPVHLRVLVDQGGCSGLEYKFRIEHAEQPEEDDMYDAKRRHSDNAARERERANTVTIADMFSLCVICMLSFLFSVISIGGESVWVDRDSWLWLRGSRIEYQIELARSAFIVASNPNATQACGCKSSFAPKVDPRIAIMAAETKAAAAAASVTSTASTTNSSGSPASAASTSQL